MKSVQHQWENGRWNNSGEASNNAQAQLCLVFGSRPTLEANPDYYTQLRAFYPKAEIVTTSTAGNIVNESMLDETILATSVLFEKTKLKSASFQLNLTDDVTLGKEIARHFDAPDLAYILVLSCSGINAGSILAGLNNVLKGRVPVSGGVAGDDTRFEKTLVGLNNELSSSQIVAVAMYGNAIKIGHGSKGGWDTFGPRRKITKCNGNILFEIDNKPALNLYREYLGDKANELPASALLFPFAIIDPETKEQIVRGVQNIDEEKNALILYADVNEGDTLQLMRCDFDRLIDGAGNSARETFLNNNNASPELALLISCIARRLVLGQLTEEELVETRKALGPNPTICGFYSYTELSPVVGDNACHLHNQTMTITTFREE
ncbi:MAG: FIST C-terminal domain-containing protein [Bacteroidia bacterium]|nr:FIST C-terminal domain-containing protein [Bacteroidia bacterium]